MTDNINREGWRFEHITTPRRTWEQAGLERKRALPTDVELMRKSEYVPPPVRKGDVASLNYPMVFMYPSGRWYWKYTEKGKRIRSAGGGFATDHDAARDYNAHIEAFGLNRCPLDIADVEDKSA